MRPGGACTVCPGFSLSRHSRPQATPGRWTERKSHSPGTAAHRWTQPPQRAHRATQPGKGTGTQASPETGHRAAHSGAQAQAIHSPGNNTAGNAHKRPTEPPGVGVLSLYYPPPKRPTAAHRAAHRGQAAGGYGNAGEGKPTAATAPAQHPGQKSGRFSVIFRAIFCHFSRLCPALPVSFIVESR